MNLKRVQTGEVVRGWPNRTWNQLVAGEERDRAAQRRGGVQPPAAPAGPAYVRVRNDSGGAVGKGEALALGAALAEPTDEDPSAVFQGLLFAGETPAGDSRHVAILIGPAAAGEVGIGVIPNAAWARVEVDAASDEFAGPQASTVLRSAASGPLPILWKPSGTGEKWAVVQLSAGGGAGLVTGVLVADVPARSYAADAVRLERWDGGGWVVDPDEDPIYGINRSFQNARGSAGLQVAVRGMLRTIDLGGGATAQGLEFDATDLAVLPGALATTVDGVPQMPFKLDGTRQFTLDGGPCEDA